MIIESGTYKDNHKVACEILDMTFFGKNKTRPSQDDEGFIVKQPKYKSDLNPFIYGVLQELIDAEDYDLVTMLRLGSYYSLWLYDGNDKSIIRKLSDYGVHKRSGRHKLLISKLEKDLNITSASGMFYLPNFSDLTLITLSYYEDGYSKFMKIFKNIIRQSPAKDEIQEGKRGEFLRERGSKYL